MSQTKKILITGANGLLGQKFLALTKDENALEVIPTSRSVQALQLEGVSVELMDITNQEQVERLISSYKPDIVVNTAAMTQVDACESDRENAIAINTEAPAFIAKLSKANDFQFIHISTDFIFDGKAGPYREDDQPNPVNFYGQTKLDAERKVLEENPDSCILRTVLVYGIAAYMSRSNIVLWTRESLLNGKEIKVVTDQWRTPTLAEDLAQGVLLAIHKEAKGIFNISGREMMSPYQISQETAKVFGLDATLIKKADSSTFSQPAMRPPKTGFIIEKAENNLGYKPHSFTEGLELIKSQLQAFK